MRHVRHAIVGLLLVVCTTLTAQQTRSSASGVYTAEQAAAGEKIYFDKCAACHGDDLGGREQAPALGGGPFVESWSGRDLRQLLDRIDAMPPTAPKSLSPADSVGGAGLPPAGRGDAERTDRAADRSRAARAGSRFERDAVAARGVGRARRGSRRGRRRAGGLRPAAGARRGPGGAARGATTTGPSTGWPTYGGNLASHRYSPADQITKDNFNRLEIAWRLKTDFLGPRPDTLYSATPLVVDRVLYTTAGMRRAAIALDAVDRRNALDALGRRGTPRAERAAQRRRTRPRLLGGANGTDRRVIYVTPGYRMLALDAKTGTPDPDVRRRTAPSI